eukprot:403354052
MNQKKFSPQGFMEEFEISNWKDLNFHEHLEHFTYSENELSPQFSYFSAGQTDKLQATAFLPHHYQNNSVVPQNILGLQQYMMVQQKKDFPQQQQMQAVAGIQTLSNQQLPNKILSPFPNAFACSPQQDVINSSCQNLSMSSQNIVQCSQLSLTSLQQQQHYQQEDAIMNLKEGNQCQFNQQQFQSFKQGNCQSDIESCRDASMSLLNEKCQNSNSSQFEQPQLIRGVLSQQQESAQVNFQQQLQSISNNQENILTKNHSQSSSSSLNYTNNQQQKTSSMSNLSLLPFNLQEEKTVDNHELVGKKRRGRRKIEDDQYYAITNDKIQEWEHILQNQKNLSKKDKKILRNRISAQKSRNKKKEEFGSLNSQIDLLKDRYRQLFEILEDNTCAECKENIINCLQNGQSKRQKLSHQHNCSNTHNAATVTGKGKAKNLMKMMLGFVSVAQSTQQNGNSMATQEQSRNLNGFDPEESNKLQMQPQKETLQFMTINLTFTQTSRQRSLNVSGKDTVMDIKRSIQIMEGLPIACQNIQSGQTELNDFQTISEIISEKYHGFQNEIMDLSLTVNNHYIQ